MKLYTVKKVLLCTLLAVLMLCSVSAATWDEMRENGAVSDDGIRLGDARDGIVSDVSEHNGDGILGDIITDASDAIGGIMGEGDGGMHNGTDNLPGSHAPSTTVPRTTAPQTTANQGISNGDTASGGMSMGIIIAILVVVAVIVVIFMLLPKRK